MDRLAWVFGVVALAPVVLMVLWMGAAQVRRMSVSALWRAGQGASLLAVLSSVAALWVGADRPLWPGVLQTSALGLSLAVLVQLLGAVITGFSGRYLDGEAGQRRYVAALAAVLAAVQLLLLADHWLVLMAAWAGVGVALQHLLCFYPDRPFARLAAHKKRIADRAADALLLAAAGLAWHEVGSGSLSALWGHVAREGLSLSLHVSAVALALAVVLRTALMPVHGWLIQVMEAPTPVSALLHAGVVNLGGFVLIRFAPLLEQAAVARWMLLALGLSTAVLAGMVMLTRISIKVRLAWSTVAQMGFMLAECALGLYTLAALHLIGHSLYKAHAFLSASSVVRQTRLQALHPTPTPSWPHLALAPACAVPIVMGVASLTGSVAWPWWWSVVLGLAWAPLLWPTAAPDALRARVLQGLAGLLLVAGLTGIALLAHALPLGLVDAPQDGLGVVALLGMSVLYGALALLQWRPQQLAVWRRWSYAGFYVDEAYTRLALRWWPANWAPRAGQPAAPATSTPSLADVAR